MIGTKESKCNTSRSVGNHQPHIQTPVNKCLISMLKSLYMHLIHRNKGKWKPIYWVRYATMISHIFHMRKQHFQSTKNCFIRFSSQHTSISLSLSPSYTLWMCALFSLPRRRHTTQKTRVWMDVFVVVAAAISATVAVAACDSPLLYFGKHKNILCANARECMAANILNGYRFRFILPCMNLRSKFIFFVLRS